LKTNKNDLEIQLRSLEGLKEYNTDDMNAKYAK